jgi:hypothetical protein
LLLIIFAALSSAIGLVQTSFACLIEVDSDFIGRVAGLVHPYLSLKEVTLPQSRRESKQHPQWSVANRIFMF